MDATTFTAMRSENPASDGIASSVAVLLTAKEAATEVVTTLANWTTLCVSQCFTKVRGRPQFDEEHQRSLLSCHTTDDESYGHFPEEQAMLELRRRVQQVDLPQHTRPMSFAQELEATYKRHKALQESEASVPSRRREKAASADAASMVWTDADQALDEILNTKVEGSFRSSDPGKAEDLRRLSVDELLALRIPSPTSTMSIPDKTGSDIQDEIDISNEGRELREWLQGIDATRASEFVAYARSFEQQGFLTLDDLAQLDENDVEQAMSEVGISKFAHRARIRKAILRLPLDGAGADAQFVEPASAG